MKIVTIIQCRTGSKRLPKKALLKLGKYRLIEWVIRRVKKSKLTDKVVLATSNTRKDKILLKIGKKLKIQTYAGSEENVFSRFRKIQQKFRPNFVIRVCADNPFIDPKEIDKLINFSVKKKSEYAFNHIPYKKNYYIDGVGAECIFSKYFLKYKKEVEKNSFHREHVTSYIWKFKKKFKFKYFISPKKYSYPSLKLDIDYKKDYIKFYNILKSYNGLPEKFNNKKIIQSLLKSKN